MSNRIFKVTASILRLRREPSTSADIIARLERGQLVARLDAVERGAWWRIFADTPGDGAYVGYADAAWLAPWTPFPLDTAQTPTTRRADAPPAPVAAPAPPPAASAAPSAPATLASPASTAVAYGAPLSVEGVQAEADRLGVPVVELWTVLEVETRGEGFFTGGAMHKLPRILYERHIFSDESGHAFDAQHPHISSRRRYSNKDGTPPDDSYGGFGHQYPRLAAAAALDRAAALKACSWGIGQVLGQNHAIVGYSDVEAMVADMRVSEDLQLRAFGNYLVNVDLLEALRRHRWDEVARKYNGPSYKDFQYDKQLADKYQARKDRAPDLLLRRAQAYLKQLGKYRSGVDGDWGPGSRRAVEDYLRAKGAPFGPNQLERKPDAGFLRDLIAEAEKDAAATPAAPWPLD